ncbi:MAG: AI-2E family transporter [Chloroflexota bacterium]|nr:AI-2E family transporter [Chloroflexota bacterium]
MSETDSAGARGAGMGLTERAAWRVASRGVLLVIAVLIALWLVVQLQAVVSQVLVAIILAAGMTPVVNRVVDRPLLVVGRRRWSPPRVLVVLLLYLLLLAAAAAIGALVVPPVVADIESLVRRLPTYAAELQALVAELPSRYPFLPPLDLDQGLAAQLGAGAQQLAAVLGQVLAVVQVAMGVLTGALNGIFILVLALYLTADGERIRRYLVGFLPAQRREQAQGVLAAIGERLGGWVRGQILLCVVIGAVTLGGLWLIGVPYAALLALVAALGELIPMIGPILSAIPAVAVAFTQSPAQGLLTLGFYVLVQQIENYVVVPRIMERAVNIHPLGVMLALLAGAELYGITGAILSLPVAAAVAVLLAEVRRARGQDEPRVSSGAPSEGRV